MFAAGGAVMCLPSVALSALRWPTRNNAGGTNSSCTPNDVCTRLDVEGRACATVRFRVRCCDDVSLKSLNKTSWFYCRTCW